VSINYETGVGAGPD